MLDRPDTQFARQAFELFAPHHSARRKLEALLADSIRHANEEGTSCWEITLRRRELFFNVGQVALLIIRPNEVDVYYRWTPAVTSLTSSSEPVGYKRRAIDAPIRVVTLALDGTLRIAPALRIAHRSAIRAAAQAKSISPWAYRHSPEVLALLRRHGHHSLPDPAYARGVRPARRVPSLRNAGAGFGSSVENALVELAAIQLATKHYRDQGYSVQSTQRDRVGFDLLCEKGRAKLFVEVKGVRGTQRNFLMTRGELALSSRDPRFRLALVTQARSAKATVVSWSAREFLRDFDATAITYSVRFVGQRRRRSA